MGYYTYFTLNYEDNLNLYSPDKINDEIEKLNVFEDSAGDEFYGSAKWYDHDSDMSLLSSKFPGVLFTLWGDGEESDDMWYEYFIDGEVQYAPARIEYDSYDRLKTRRVIDDSYTKYSYQS